MAQFRHHLRQAPKLEDLVIKVHFGREGQVRVEAHGESPLARKSLWTLVELWPEDNPVYGPYDMVSHLVLAVAQDRPNTQERVEFTMNGGLGWMDEELPFPQ